MGYFEQYFQQQASRQSYFEPIYAKQTFALGADAIFAPLVMRNRPVDPGIYKLTVTLPIPITFDDYWKTQGTFDLGKQQNVGQCGVWIRGQDGLLPSNYMPNFEAKLAQGYDPTTEQNVEFYRSYTAPLMNEQGMITGFYYYMIMLERWDIPAGLTAPIDVFFDFNGNIIAELPGGYSPTAPQYSGSVDEGASYGVSVNGLGALPVVAGILLIGSIVWSYYGDKKAQIQLKIEQEKTRRAEIGVAPIKRLIDAGKTEEAVRLAEAMKHIVNNSPSNTGKVGGGLLAGLSWLPWAIGLGLLWALVRK